MLWWTLRKLRSSDQETRKRAVMELVKFPTVDALEALIVSLKDPYDDVRENAAEALARIRDERALEPLIAALADSSNLGDCKVAVMNALDKINARWKKSEAARDASVKLIAAQGHWTHEVREAARNAIDRIDTHWTKSEAARIAVPKLISALEGGQGGDYWAADTLGRIGDDRALGPLISALTKKESVKGATWFNERVTEALDKIDAQWEKSEAARIALPQLIQVLVENTHLYFTHWDVVKALGRIGDERALEPLISALPPQRSQLTAAAAEALGRIGHQRALGPLISALTYDDHAKSYAKNIGMPDARWANSELAKVVAEALDKIDAYWEMSDAARIAVPELIRALIGEQTTAATKKVVAKALGRIADERALEPLIGALTHYDSSVGEAAAEALDKIDKHWTKSEAARIAMPHLIRGLAHKDPDARKRVAEALDKIDTHWTKSNAARLAEPQLIAALNDPDIREAAAEALDKIWEGGVEHLIAALFHRNVDVRRDARMALGENLVVRLIKPLRELLEANQFPHRIAPLLAQLLERDAPVVLTEDLVAIAALQDAVHHWVGWACAAVPKDCSEPVDCSYLRQLARQELIRRRRTA